mgnify:CR=1 FL=1
MLFDYYVWLYLQLVFNGPARMIARSDEMEKLAKAYSICKI